MSSKIWLKCASQRVPFHHIKYVTVRYSTHMKGEKIIMKKHMSITDYARELVALGRDNTPVHQNLNDEFEEYKDADTYQDAIHTSILDITGCRDMSQVYARYY